MEIFRGGPPIVISVDKSLAVNTPFARAGPTEGVLWRVPPWNLGNP